MLPVEKILRLLVRCDNEKTDDPVSANALKFYANQDQIPTLRKSTSRRMASADTTNEDTTLASSSSSSSSSHPDFLQLTPSSSTASTAILHGFLLRQSLHLKRWEQRYYILRDRFLFCCKRQPPRLEQGIAHPYLIIFLDGAVCKPNPTTHHQFAFLLTDSVNKMEYILCAESMKEMKEWIKAIRIAIRACEKAKSRPSNLILSRTNSKNPNNDEFEELPPSNSFGSANAESLSEQTSSVNSPVVERREIKKSTSPPPLSSDESDSSTPSTVPIIPSSRAAIARTHQAPLSATAAASGRKMHFPPPSLSMNDEELQRARVGIKFRSESPALGESLNDSIDSETMENNADFSQSVSSNASVIPSSSSSLLSSSPLLPSSSSSSTSPLTPTSSSIDDSSLQRAIQLRKIVLEKLKKLKLHRKVLAKEIRKLETQMREANEKSGNAEVLIKQLREFNEKNVVERLELANLVVALKSRFKKAEPESLMRNATNVNGIRKTELDCLEESSAVLKEIQEEIVRVRSSLKQAQLPISVMDSSEGEMEDEMISNAKKHHQKLQIMFLTLLEDDGQLRATLNALHKAILKLTQDKLNDFNAKVGLTVNPSSNGIKAQPHSPSSARFQSSPLPQKPPSARANSGGVLDFNQKR